jgi:uncharacterized repeat protein (TIGR03943 family)
VSGQRNGQVRAATVVAAMSAATLLRISVTGEYLNFVRPSMRIPLLISGVLLGLVALADVLGLLQRRPAAPGAQTLQPGDQHGHEHRHDQEHGHGHGHEHGETKVAWLLLVPVLTLLVFTPPALSGWGASRQSNNRTIGLDWAPLTVTPGQPVELSMRDFVGRALEVGAPTVTGVEVRLTGFVNEVTPDSFTVVRYSIACCAADALASSVVVTGVTLPSADVGPNELRWVSVTGTLASVSGVVPTLAATDAVAVQEPRDPYDS